MSKKLPLYVIGFCLVLLVFAFFEKAYQQLTKFSELSGRHSLVYTSFQKLHYQVNNAAVSNPQLLSANTDGALKHLFFADSTAVMQPLLTLKATVRDSVNIQITRELDSLLSSQLNWIILSNVPDSILHNQAVEHVQAFEKITGLINRGILRTTYLIELRKAELSGAMGDLRRWLFGSITVSILLLAYFIVNLIQQQRKTISTQKELTKSEKQFRALVENSDDIIVLLDNNLRPFYRSPSAERIMGWNESDSRGMEQVHPEDLAKVREAVQQARANPGKSVEMVFRVKHKQGHYLWLQGSLSDMLNDPNVGGLVMNVHNITARRELQEQNALLAAIVTSSDDAILSKTLDGEVISWNKGAEKIFGYSSAEIIGKNVSILIPPHLQAEEKDIISKIRLGKNIEHYETVRLRKNGSSFNVSLTISPIKDDNGNIIGAAKICRDITENKKAEHALSESLREVTDYKYALEESSIVAITDQKGIIIYANDNFCKISKYSREELIGKDHRIINSGHHSKQFIRSLWVTIANGKIWKGELKNKAKDGSVYWVDTTIVPFLNKEGKPYQYVAIRADITQRKQAEEEVASANNEKHTLLNRISDGVVSVDNEWHYTFLNDAALGTHLPGRENTLGRVIWDVHPEMKGTIFYTKYHEAMETKKTVEVESYYAPMGVWFSVRVYPSIDGLTIYYKDITERKKAELALAESLREVSDYKFALEESSIVAITDQKGIITYANDNFCKISKYNKEELIGQDHKIINSGYHPKEFIRNLWRTIAHGNIWKGELKNKAKDGSVYWVDTTIVPFLNKEGKPYQYVAIRADITNRKIAEAQILSLNEELEKKIEDRTLMLRETLIQLESSKNELAESLEKEKELSELKTRFVSTVSHEFRTPLSTILSSAALLAKYVKEDEQPKRDKHVGRIKEGVMNLNTMLEDLLSLGKLEEGLIEAKYDLINCDAFMEHFLSEMKELTLPGQSISFVHNGNKQILSDKRLLKNILLNLVSNAIKFSPPNSVIEVCWSALPGQLVLSVKDSGIGISAEDQQHLFERFFRAKNALNIQGTGLGLHIVTKYLELLQGTITVESEVNHGTKFIITIPIT